MTNEEFQNLVLSEFKFLKSDISGMKDNILGLKSDVSNIKSDMSGMKDDILGLKSDASNIKSDMSDMKDDILGLKSDMSDMKIQLDENTQIVKGIRHNQEFTNAKLEGIELTTAKAQVVDDRFETLNQRLFDQEAQLQMLKLVK